MSQVIRKFDNGGPMAVASNQMPPKRGHLIIDRTSYDANNEGFIDQLLNFG